MKEQLKHLVTSKIRTIIAYINLNFTLHIRFYYKWVHAIHRIKMDYNGALKSSDVV